MFSWPVMEAISRTVLARNGQLVFSKETGGYAKKVRDAGLVIVRWYRFFRINA
jgi:hypothetical protein